MKQMTFFKKAIILGMGMFVNYCVQAQGQTLVWSLEAEEFDLAVPANPNDPNNYPKATIQEPEQMPDGECTVSGCGFLENISANSYVVYNDVEVPEEGTYELHMYYMLGDPARGVGVWANYQVRDTMWITDPTGSWNGEDSEVPNEDPDLPPVIVAGTPKLAKMLIYLEKGKNILNIGGCGNNYTPNFDRFEIYTTDKKIDKPSNISCSWHWDYTDEIVNKAEHDANIKRAYDNNDATFARLGKNDHIDFNFDVPFGMAGFLVFTEYGDTAFHYNGLKPWAPGEYEIQVRVDENSDWIPLVPDKEVTGRGKGRVYSTDKSRSTQYKGIRLQLNAQDSVTLREIQLFGHPLLDSVDVAEVPEEPVSYPASLMQAEIINYRTIDETVSENSNGLYKYNRQGVFNEKNKWFQGPTKAVDRKRTTKFVMENVKDFQLEWQFLNPVAVKSYGIATCAMNSDTEIKSSPATWVLEGSADFGETYDTIAVVSDFDYPECSYINMNFPVAEEHWQDQYGMTYQYYRLSVKNGGAWKSQLSEWQLFGEPLPEMGEKEEGNLVSEAELTGVRVYANPQGIRICSDCTETLVYKVFSLSGVMLTSGCLEGTQDVALGEGLYVVKVSSEKSGVFTTKAAVR